MTKSEIMFESVTQQFKESVESLEKLRGHLDSLTDAEEHQTKSTKSIDTAAHRLREMIQELHGMVQALNTATETTQSAMSSVKQFFQDTELNSLKADFATLSTTLASELNTMKTDIHSVQNSLSDRLEKLQEERDEAQADSAQSKRQLEELETKIAQIPQRQKQKYGLIS